MKEKLTLTVEELGERLGICRAGAYELAHSKGFPVIVVGRRILIPVAGLERWIENQSGGGDAA